MAKKKLAPPPEALKVLNQLLQACAETQEYLSMCKDCMLDVDKEERQNKEQMEIASKIKARFFPDEP